MGYRQSASNGYGVAALFRKLWSGIAGVFKSICANLCAGSRAQADYPAGKVFDR
jgi:hypothetical protein